MTPEAWRLRPNKPDDAPMNTTGTVSERLRQLDEASRSGNNAVAQPALRILGHVAQGHLTREAQRLTPDTWEADALPPPCEESRTGHSVHRLSSQFDLGGRRSRDLVDPLHLFVRKHEFKGAGALPSLVWPACTRDRYHDFAIEVDEPA